MIIYPNITKVIKNQEQKTFKISMEGIIKSVRNDMADDDGITPRYYYYDNGKLILLKVKQDEKNEVVKTIGKANASGYIFVDNSGHILINAICNRKYCGYNTEESETIQIKKNTGENQGEFDLDAPLITLKGNEKITLGLGKRYIEYGAVAKTIGGEDISQDIVIQIMKDGKEQETVDTNKAGVYEITYSITHKKKKASVKRTITVIDSRPEIIFTQAESTYVKKKEVTIKIKTKGENTVYNFIYRINDGKEITVTGNQTTISLEETGTYTIFAEATDNKGNKNSKKSDLYKIDSIPPSLMIEPATVTLKTTEVASYDIMTGIQVTDNIDTNLPIITSGTLEANVGIQTITYTATDQAGNRTTQERTFNVIEADGPILNFSSLNTNGWVTKTNITITATDNSNLKNFSYEIIKNNVSMGIQNISVSGNNASTTIPLNTDGMYIIHLIATDIYDNESTLSSGTYQVDATAPTAPTAMNFVFGDWSPYLDNTWTNQSIYAGSTASSPGPTGSTDATSGIWKYQISVDNQTWIDYQYETSGIYLMDTNGVHNRYFRAVDYAGNVSPSIHRTSKIDKTNPSTPTITAIPNGFDATGTKLQITLTATDNESGIWKYVISYGPQSLTQTKTIVTTDTNVVTELTGLASDTIYYINVTVYDQAGNIATSPVISAKTSIQVVTITNSNDPSSDTSFTIVSPSSKENPTIIELKPVAKSDLIIGIHVLKKIKAGDTITISYTVNRYGTDYFDIWDNQHTPGILETNPTTSQNGVERNKTFTALQDTDYYRVVIGKTDTTSSSVYGTLSIYSITINGEKVL